MMLTTGHASESTKITIAGARRAHGFQMLTPRFGWAIVVIAAP